MSKNIGNARGWNNVPDEIFLKKILPHCSGKGLRALGQTCRRMAYLCESPHLWLACIKKEYPRQAKIMLPFKDWSTPQQYRSVAPEEAREHYIKIDNMATAQRRRREELRRPVAFEEFLRWQRMENMPRRPTTN